MDIEQLGEPWPETDLSQCENYDDDGVRCHHQGKYYEGAERYLCQNCADGYGMFEA